MGFEYNYFILKVLRFSEKKVSMKKNNTPKEIVPQSKDLNVRAKTDFLLFTGGNKKEEKGGGGK